MKKIPNSTKNQEPWSVRIKNKVWDKADIIPFINPMKIRKDRYGKEIHYDYFGDRTSSFGWEIDHILPISKGGTDKIDNLQPLYWQTNDLKGEQFPWTFIE